MDEEGKTSSEQMMEGDPEMRLDIYVRQAVDQTLPAPEVLAAQQGVLSRRISGPPFIP